MKMEALQRLEGVQRMVGLMHNHSIFGPDAASDRFLAEFLIFMVQACTDEHEMAGRCNLLADQLPKMPATLLEEALCCKAKQDDKELQYRATNKGNKDTTSSFFPSLARYTVEGMPLVGLDAIERAKSTLEDFVRSYFMFHDVEVHILGSWFKYLPILTFVESYIYQLDAMNEEVLTPSREDSFNAQINLKDVQNEQEMTDPFGPLRNALGVRGLMTERINKELRDGMEYWTLERSLCNAASKGTEISIQDAMRALQLKSFDYRVLNLLMYRLTKQQVNECHWDFLSISEFLVEISDDLYDYEEDVLNNNFNILRMFVKVYKPLNAPTMMAKCIIEAEEKYQLLLNQLDPSLVAQYQKRCEEATKEGGKVSAHSLGSWTIPAVISDEECYRSRLQGSN